MIEKLGRSIPIILGPARSGAADTFAHMPPVTLVHVAHGNSEVHDGTAFYALLDTGADATCIDENVADAIGAKLFGNGIAHGFGNPRSGVKAAEVSIIFPSANFTFHCQRAAVMQFHRAGQTFDVLLGRDFLQLCRFSLDGPNHIYRAEIVV